MGDVTDWTCPTCDRPLRNPRIVAVGCMGLPGALGECPMHRTITPRAPLDALARQLNRRTEPRRTRSRASSIDEPPR